MTASLAPVRLAGRTLSRTNHVCAFFNSREEQNKILMPFFKDGYDQGDKLFQVVDTNLQEEHRCACQEGGIDVAAAEASGQLEIHDWESTYVKDGYFDAGRMIRLIEDMLQVNHARYEHIRVTGNMEWALKTLPGVQDVIEYETKLNYVLPKYPDSFVFTRPTRSSAGISRSSITEPDRQAGIPQRVLEQAAQTGKCEIEGWRVRKDGSTFWGIIIVDAIRDPAGNLLGFAKVTRDLTERRTAEEQLRQAQKMEAIGHLTGGIAHDFNNLLGVIAGNLEMLQHRLQAQGGGDLLRWVSSALRGAMRAALLTQRLLAFARRQPLEPKAIVVNDLVSGMSDMLRRTLGEAIAIETVLAGGLWRTFVDGNQLESALLNLAVNARDAMPDGGKLTIEAANVYLDEQYAAKEGVPAGQYVGIFVSDTGVGMPPDIVAQAFEPFFTTKEMGHGTGLGLSQVYGFMKQSGGHAEIYSEVGGGTTVKLYLPRHHDLAAEVQAEDAGRAVVRGTNETILVVDDDPDIRATTVEVIRELGYRVIEAPDGATALRLLDAHRDIALLFTDVGLPGGMNGRQLSDEARRRRPALKVLFTSGYARNAIVHHGRLDPGVELLPKPFTYAALAMRIRQSLHSA